MIQKVFGTEGKEEWVGEDALRNDGAADIDLLDIGRYTEESRCNGVTMATART